MISKCVCLCVCVHINRGEIGVRATRHWILFKLLIIWRSFFKCVSSKSKSLYYYSNQSFILGFKVTTCQHWFILWLSNDQATRSYLNQRYDDPLQCRIYLTLQWAENMRSLFLANFVIEIIPKHSDNKLYFMLTSTQHKIRGTWHIVEWSKERKYTLMPCIWIIDSVSHATPECLFNKCV